MFSNIHRTCLQSGLLLLLSSLRCVKQVMCLVSIATHLACFLRSSSLRVQGFLTVIDMVDLLTSPSNLWGFVFQLVNILL